MCVCFVFSQGAIMSTLITNNPLAVSRYRHDISVDYAEEPLLSLLIRVRDLVHSGCRLLTHPLSGSVKPNESPYKSVLISEEGGGTDPQSVNIIEECITAVRKFPAIAVPELCLPDLQEVDLSLVKAALDHEKRGI